MSIIGICGRQGSGKTTIADYVSPKTTLRYRKIKYPIFYILETIFGWKYNDIVENKDLDKDPVWGFTVTEATNLVNELLAKIDSNIILSRDIYIPEEYTHINQKYIQYSFADPVKKIASVIFNFPNIKQHKLYKILQGNDENRILRENIKTIEYNGKIFTGRTCLEYLGTDIFRNLFDKKIWVKIFQRNATEYIKNGINIVISDVRFKNEMETITPGKLMLVYRDESELVITDMDRQTHKSKWGFLKFINNMEKIYKIHNNGSKEELYFKIDDILNLKR